MLIVRSQRATLALRLEAMRRRSGWQMGLGFMPAAAVNSGSRNIHSSKQEKSMTENENPLAVRWD
ncbi:MAG: hypothetical protein WA679_15620, partial [Pseudolabrys sp.]